MEKTGPFTEFRYAAIPPSHDIFRQVPEALLVEWDDEVTDIGIPHELRKEIAAHLYKARADSHVLCLRITRCYWNIKGAVAHGLRHLLKDQARELDGLQDGLGLRIRALSFEVPSSLLEYLELSELRERSSMHTAEQMLRELAAGHAQLARNLKAAFGVLERAYDRATMDVFTHHIAFHETSMRTLLSCLQNDSDQLTQ